MKQLINNINSKPYHVRRRWLIGTTAAVTIVILVVWGITIKASLHPVETAEQVTSEPTASAIDSLGDKIKEAWGSLKEGIAGTVNEFEKLTSSTPQMTEKTNN